MTHPIEPTDAINHKDSLSHRALPQLPSRQTDHKSDTSPFQVPTPILPLTLQHYLEGYNDNSAKTLVSGFQNGFSLGSIGSLTPSIYRNHSSVSEHQAFVKNKIISDIKLGRVKGPYLQPPFSNFVSSPLGVVPKKSANSFRIIHDLSFPKNSQSVNSTIPYENSTVTLETFDDVANLVLSAGKNCLIAKADIEEAFKIIPISPLDYHKLGFSFNNCFYFQTVLPMGASSSVQIFESFSKALQWILQNKFQVRRVSHIVDDFIFVGPANTNTCQAALDTFLNLASDLGVPIKNDKTIQPSTCVEVHGILLDTCTLMAKLPQDKLDHLKLLVSKFMYCKKVSLQKLQSILGHLNFACKVIKPGRCFLRRLYNATKGHSNPSHLVKLTKECRADLKRMTLGCSKSQ